MTSRYQVRGAVVWWQNTAQGNRGVEGVVSVNGEVQYTACMLSSRTRTSAIDKYPTPLFGDQ